VSDAPRPAATGSSDAGSGSFHHLGDRVVYRGRVWEAVVGSFVTPEGARFEREIVRARGAVASVPISYADEDGGREHPLVTLIAQYRASFDAVVVEVPAGTRDVAGEPDIDNARRELAEEVGLAAAVIEPLATIYPSPGLTDSNLAVFLALDCTPVERDPHGPEEEHAEVVTVPLATAIGWIDSGRIHHSTTIVGLLLADRRLRTSSHAPH
jgi:ADP-ribose pyrophosphatase